MHSAIVAELLGIGGKLSRIDDRRVIFRSVISIEPGENDADIVFVRRLELFAGQARQVDLIRRRRRAPIGAASQNGGKECGGHVLHRVPPDYSSKRRLAAFTMSRNLTMSSSIMRR